MTHAGHVSLGLVVASVLFSCRTTCSSTADRPLHVLRYPLHSQYIRNWLVAGPQVVRVTELDAFKGENDDVTKRNILKHYYRAESEITEMPREGEAINIDASSFPWRYFRCEDDNSVAFGQGGGCVYFKTWAYAEVDCPSSCTGQWEVAVHGPVDVWGNAKHVLRKEDLSIFVPVKHAFTAGLKKGTNEVLVRFEAVKIRVGVYGMALRLPDTAIGAEVVLPTLWPEAAERQRAERVVGAAYLDREFFTAKDTVTVHWSGDLSDSANVSVALRNSSGDVVVRKEVVGTRGATITLAEPARLTPGRYSIEVTPLSLETDRIRELCKASLGFAVIRSDYSERPYGTYDERRTEALERAAAQDGLYAQIAKMELGRWSEVESAPFLQAVDKINRRNDTSDFEMVGLIGATHRYAENPSFPRELKRLVEDCILHFKYWADEPGKDMMWYWSENHQITFHACEILAGQLYPDGIFTNAGKNGRWHREKGEKLALTWLRRRLANGFHEWDSNTYFSVDLLALSHLADLAATDEVREMASAVLSKMLFTIALNSYKGVFGSTHARTYPGDVKSGRNEGTSGAARLMWGLGNFTDGKSYVSLALMKRYRLPPVIEKIATLLPEEMWNRERHGGVLDPAVDYFGGSWEVNQVTYKTRDYMLSSAQDYRPGGRGNMQHIWQATLGPDAVVFVTHPPFLAESGSPNFWAGHLVLPRVAQWKDILIDVRSNKPDEGMGFTHAYFPMFAFDECVFGDRWALARKGDGYIALSNTAGIELVRSGRCACRELRSYSNRSIWICQMGSKQQDGSFSAFRERVEHMPLACEDLTVKCTTIRGDELSFGWSEPLVIDGKEVPLKNFMHYENPYCTAALPAESMSIRYGEDRVKLSWPKLEEGER